MIFHILLYRIKKKRNQNYRYAKSEILFQTIAISTIFNIFLKFKVPVTV